jgi:hypothetical protein
VAYISTTGPITIDTTAIATNSEASRRIDILAGGATTSVLTISGKITGRLNNTVGLNTSGLGSGIIKLTNTSNDFTDGVLLVDGTWRLGADVAASGAQPVALVLVTVQIIIGH